MTPAVPASAACQAANSDSRVLRAILNAGDNAEGVPPLIWHGGAVMGTSQTGPLVLTPIFWNPASNPMAASYKSLITQYLSDVAAASGSTTNVFSVLTQYTGTDGQVQYQVQLGNPINDTNPLTDDQNRRAIRLTIWSWWYTFIGNVLGSAGQSPGPGKSFVYEESTFNLDTEVPMWELGYNGSDGSAPQDAKVVETVIRYGNYDYVTNTVH